MGFLGVLEPDRRATSVLVLVLEVQGFQTEGFQGTLGSNLDPLLGCSGRAAHDAVVRTRHELGIAVAKSFSNFRVVVGIEAFAAFSLRNLNGRITVGAVGVGEEDDRSVEVGGNLVFTAGHLGIPNFQVSTIFFLPMLVEVDQQIDAAPQT